MEKSEKILIWLLMICFGVFALFVCGWSSIQEYFHPNPEKVLSRMERRDQSAAQEIINNYAEGLKEIAAAAKYIDLGYRYSYRLDPDNSWNKEELEEMPQELVDALMEMEQRFPTCKESLELHKEQIGVWLTNDTDGFSVLCYPGGDLISRSVIENGTRCLDMGDGWELQMYYAPKG